MLVDNTPMSTVLKKTKTNKQKLSGETTNNNAESISAPYISYDDGEEAMADLNPLAKYYNVTVTDAKNIRVVFM